MLHLSIHNHIVWIRHFTPMIRPQYLCFSGHVGLECESGRKKRLQACYMLRKETKLHSLIFHFSAVKMRSHGEAFDRCTNPPERPRGTDPPFPIHVQRLFLCLIVRIEHNTKLTGKISCDSPDCSGQVMRNYWTEQRKSNDYIQKEEAEKFCFGHRSMKAQHKYKKSSQAWTSPEEQRLSGERTEIAQ